MNVTRSAILPYSDQQIFSIIADIPSYPEFLPGCKNVEILQNSDTEVVATLQIVHKALKITFTTKNFMEPNSLISMQLQDGPFSALSGAWKIIGLGNGASKVELSLDFAFSNPITHKLFGSLFESVSKSQFDAFQQRAKQLYGA